MRIGVRLIPNGPPQAPQRSQPYPRFCLSLMQVLYFQTPLHRCHNNSEKEGRRTSPPSRTKSSGRYLLTRLSCHLLANGLNPGLRADGESPAQSGNLLLLLLGWLSGTDFTDSFH
jgi:hypothetical protein